MEDFLIRALVTGVGIALVSGPLGCFLIWRRLAYLGDACAHAALFGVLLGLWLNLEIQWAVMGIAVVMALCLVRLQKQAILPSDTWLAILSQGALALSLVVVSLSSSIRIDLMSLLFGDILSVGPKDMLWVYALVGATLFMLVFFWRSFLSVVIHEEIARTEGSPTQRIQHGLMILIAATVAVGMKIIGALLMISLLIIPAASARFFSKTPEQMAILSSVLGMLAVTIGLFGSVEWDIPSGPAIVIAAGALGVGMVGLKNAVKQIKKFAKPI
ncbi:MAG: metal ABC transporter permease [Gammaproteobacteria bacterium]|nr:metal ABC transporter permease [Gammaproteobacteria bacterium]